MAQHCTVIYVPFSHNSNPMLTLTARFPLGMFISYNFQGFSTDSSAFLTRNWLVAFPAFCVDFSDWLCFCCKFSTPQQAALDLVFKLIVVWFLWTNLNSLLRIPCHWVFSFCIDNRLRQKSFFFCFLFVCLFLFVWFFFKWANAWFSSYVENLK